MHEPARATQAIVGPTAVMYCSTGTGAGGLNFPVALTDGVGRALLVVAAAAGTYPSAGAGRKAHAINTASAANSATNPMAGATLRSSIGTASQRQTVWHESVRKSVDGPRHGAQIRVSPCQTDAGQYAPC